METKSRCPTENYQDHGATASKPHFAIISPRTLLTGLVKRRWMIRLPAVTARDFFFPVIFECLKEGGTTLLGVLRHGRTGMGVL